jgi:hypothetical protein
LATTVPGHCSPFTIHHSSGILAAASILLLAEREQRIPSRIQVHDGTILDPSAGSSRGSPKIGKRQPAATNPKLPNPRRCALSSHSSLCLPGLVLPYHPIGLSSYQSFCNNQITCPSIRCPRRLIFLLPLLVTLVTLPLLQSRFPRIILSSFLSSLLLPSIYRSSPWYGNNQNPIPLHDSRLPRPPPGVHAGKACFASQTDQADRHSLPQTQADQKSQWYDLVSGCKSHLTMKMKEKKKIHS